MGNAVMKGSSKDGVDWWRELYFELAQAYLEGCYHSKEKNVPEGNTAILSPPPSMFPGSNGQVTIDGSPVTAIGESCSCGDPGIDHQACAGIELVWLTGRIERMKSVQQGGGGDLSGML